MAQAEVEVTDEEIQAKKPNSKDTIIMRLITDETIVGVVVKKSKTSITINYPMEVYESATNGNKGAGVFDARNYLFGFADSTITIPSNHILFSGNVNEQTQGVYNRFYVAKITSKTFSE
jgi:hypothetical protein